MRTFKFKTKYIPVILLAAACTVVAILCIIKAVDSIKYNEDLSQSSIINPTQIILTADGGNDVKVPKNTSLAIDDLCQKGFSSIKIDARLTSDKKWVSLAEKDISAVTNGRGDVSTYNYYDLLNYNLKNVPEATTAIIELVQDTAKHALENDLSVIIYIHDYDKEAIKSLLTILSNLTSHSLRIASSDLRILEYSKKIIPTLNVIYYVDEITAENIDICKNDMTYALCFNAANKKNSYEKIEQAFLQNISVLCYGTQTLKDIEKLYQFGIRQFINDSVEIGDVQ